MIISSQQSTIDERLSKAEALLQQSGYNVVRHIKDGHCFGLQVFGETYWHLETVRAIVGPQYKLLLNSNNQAILIR